MHLVFAADRGQDSFDKQRQHEDRERNVREEDKKVDGFRPSIVGELCHSHHDEMVNQITCEKRSGHENRREHAFFVQPLIAHFDRAKTHHDEERCRVIDSA